MVELQRKRITVDARNIKKKTGGDLYMAPTPHSKETAKDIKNRQGEAML